MNTVTMSTGVEYKYDLAGIPVRWSHGLHNDALGVDHFRDAPSPLRIWALGSMRPGEGVAAEAALGDRSQAAVSTGYT